MSPPFVTWVTIPKGLSTETVGEDLFSWPPPNFGPKTELNLSEECYVIALNPDLLYSIFRILDLFAFTQRARSAGHFCSCCNLARNL